EGALGLPRGPALPDPHQQHQPDPARGCAGAPGGRGGGRRGRLRRPGGSAVIEHPAIEEEAPAALPPDAFVEWLRREGGRRYHHEHPFHLRMHAGLLTRHQLQQWVLNRYYYQTRIPVKDALILAKSEDPAFRRAWMRRIRDHDGAAEGEGGLARWRRLARAVGLEEAELDSLRSVLPGVRMACDAYVTMVREAGLVEAVASSLTELFAP